ncbi:MAG TPA: NAD-dependent epimerase/dehydratase family protein [Pedobacter sp.]|uniref:NAD-dependent epimerase/dehydratase family protein n=1 Tax=Pedobacter sp. TaxID=1411316 RepID=UPI002BB180F6|nr:NAD-dependent epimerase/dehydratase family protein [Pedobacter sp.]HMI01439.1 NAD-dependent epimerase/dehydratase family protein [Pedobacter sp.]
MSDQIIVVTGGSGFVGANLVKQLNRQGVNKIIIIDNYDEKKFSNIKGCAFIDFISYNKGLAYIEQELNKYEVSAILHMGANADVMIRDAEIMLHSNYDHSRFYLSYCNEHNIPLVYASSSAVYGNSNNCIINTDFEEPHNVYSWSKWMFDNFVLNNIDALKNRVIGLRFFNIFGMGEFHKGKNASLPHRFYQFIREKGFIDVFDRDIQRDYVWVDDVTRVILDVLNDTSIVNGIYNLGSGNAISHQSLAGMVANVCVERGIKQETGESVKLVPMPADLIDNFQFFTRAEDLPDFVSRHTLENDEKIRTYINQLIDFDHKHQEA